MICTMQNKRLAPLPSLGKFPLTLAFAHNSPLSIYIPYISFFSISLNRRMYVTYDNIVNEFSFFQEKGSIFPSILAYFFYFCQHERETRGEEKEEAQRRKKKINFSKFPADKIMKELERGKVTYNRNSNNEMLPFQFMNMKKNIPNISPTAHDENDTQRGGKKRGKKIIYCLSTEGVFSKCALK